MRGRAIGFLGLVSILILAALAVNVQASGPINDGSATCDSSFGGFSCSSAYDFNHATTWASASASFPHWIYVTFTQSWTVQSVVIAQDTAFTDPATDGHVDTWDGASWVNQKSWTGKGNENFTVTLDTPITTTRFRIYGTAGSNPNLWAVADTYAIGGPPITPPSVSTNAATIIVCNGAKLNGNLTSKGTASIVAVGFQYGKSPTLTNATNHTVSSNATVGVFNYTVTGLDPSTFYYFRAWANGTDGYANGSILYFQTTACAIVCVADLSAPNLAIMVILGVSAILVVVLGFAIDNFIAIMVGGLVAVLVSFQSYVLTCNVAVSIVLVAFGILLLVLPVPKLLENR